MGAHGHPCAEAFLARAKTTEWFQSFTVKSRASLSSPVDRFNSIVSVRFDRFDLMLKPLLMDNTIKVDIKTLLFLNIRFLERCIFERNGEWVFEQSLFMFWALEIRFGDH